MTRLVVTTVLVLVAALLPAAAHGARRTGARHHCNGTHHHHHTTTTTTPPPSTTSTTTTVPSTTVSTTTQPSTTEPSTTVPTTTEPTTTVPTTTLSTTTEPTTTIPTTTVPETTVPTTTVPSTTVSTTIQPTTTVPGTEPTTTSTSCSSTTTTIPTPSTTSTTLPGPQEICGNCLDDDGNGLVDDEDPACCEAPVALQVMKAKARGKKGNLHLATFRLKTRLGGAFAPANPAIDSVALQVAGDGGPVICTTLGHWLHKGKAFRFLGGTTGLTKGVFRVRRSGVALKIVGKDVDLHALPGAELRATVRIGNRCAHGLAPMRQMPKALLAP